MTYFIRAEDTYVMPLRERLLSFKNEAPKAFEKFYKTCEGQSVKLGVKATANCVAKGLITNNEVEDKKIRETTLHLFEHIQATGEIMPKKLVVVRELSVPTTHYIVLVAFLIMAAFAARFFEGENA